MTREVWVVIEYGGEYEDRYEKIVGVFATEMLAVEAVPKFRARQGWVRESGSGSENEYEVEEHSVWDTQVEERTEWHFFGYLQPDGSESMPERRPYRVAVCVPPGEPMKEIASLSGPGDSGWGEYDVEAESEEKAWELRHRLVTEFKEKA